MTKITFGLDYQRMRSALRGYYQGRKWYQALRALDITNEIHSGSRKNGEPEFSHQVFQAQFIRTLDEQLIDPEGTHLTVLYHDAPEDHEYPLNYIERDHGADIRLSVERMTNIFPMGKSKDKYYYYDEIGLDVRASVAKGADRVHNLLSAVGVFNQTKMADYRRETDNYILPMLKAARKRFPRQEPVYQNIRLVMSAAMMAENPDNSL